VAVAVTDATVGVADKLLAIPPPAGPPGRINVSIYVLNANAVIILSPRDKIYRAECPGSEHMRRGDSAMNVTAGLPRASSSG